MPATPVASRAQGLVVDHISRDTLDCRRANMCLTTPAGSSENKFPLNPKNKIGFRNVPDLGGELPYVVQITLGAAIHESLDATRFFPRLLQPHNRPKAN